MHTNVQTFGDNNATSAARLACIARIHANNLTTGAFCLVVEHLAKHTERSIVRGQGQFAVARHERKIQVFNCDQAVGLGKSGRRLVPEVAALVGNMLLQLGNLTRRFAPTRAKSLAPGQATLRAAQFAEFAAQPMRIVDQHAIGQGQKVMQTNINADRRTIMHDRRRFGQFHLQADIPLIAAALDDDVFDSGVRWNRTVQTHADRANMLHVETIAVQLASVAMAVLDALEAVAPLITRCAALSFVEGTVCLVRAAQHLLNRCGVQHTHFVGQGMALIANAIPLVDVGDAAARTLPCPTPFVQGVVVDGLHLKEQSVQQVLLLCGWVQAVLVCANHLAALLFVNVTLNHLRRHIASRAHIVAARPKTRQAAVQMWKLRSQHMRRIALDPVHDLIGSYRRGEGAKHVHMIRLDREVQNLTAKLSRFLTNQRIQTDSHRPNQYFAPVFRDPDKVVIDVVSAVPGSFALHEQIIAHLFYSCKTT